MYYISTQGDKGLKAAARPDDLSYNGKKVKEYIEFSARLMWLRNHAGDPASAALFERAYWRPVCDTQALLDTVNNR